LLVEYGRTILPGYAEIRLGYMYTSFTVFYEPETNLSVKFFIAYLNVCGVSYVTPFPCPFLAKPYPCLFIYLPYIME